MVSFSLLKNIFIKIYKFILLSVNYCSYSSFYLFFLLAAMIAFFSDKNQNFLVTFCQFFVFSLLLSSIIVFIILNFKPGFCFVKSLVGPLFLEKHFLASENNIRAFFPVFVFASTIFFLFLIDRSSLAFFDYLHNVKIDEMTAEMKTLYKEGRGFEGQGKVQDAIKSIRENVFNHGVIGKLVNNQMVQSFTDFFNKK